jgi:hypothetical protein
VSSIETITEYTYVDFQVFWDFESYWLVIFTDVLLLSSKSNSPRGIK